MIPFIWFLRWVYILSIFVLLYEQWFNICLFIKYVCCWHNVANRNAPRQITWKPINWMFAFTNEIKALLKPIVFVLERYNCYQTFLAKWLTMLTIFQLKAHNIFIKTLMSITKVYDTKGKQIILYVRSNTIAFYRDQYLSIPKVYYDLVHFYCVYA